MSIDAVIAADRALLERPGHFARTPEYARLWATRVERPGCDDERRLAQWLVDAAVGPSGLLIDTVGEPGGADLLVDQLARIAYCNLA
jgi:hypothetical protein